MSTVPKGYEDILSDRRAEISNWFWISRALDTKVAFEIKPKPTPTFIKESVFKSAKIKDLIEELSSQQNVSKKVVEKKIKLILNEIGYNKNLKIIRWLGLALTKICLKTCSGIFVNYENILELKANMGSCPVIFVPSHRSYADFIIFSYVCYTYDIAIPAIAAGMDFHGMMGMGEILRNTGAFFMRRTYNNDSLYWSTFKEYVYQLVTKGDLPIEFFIEGTRSRSNKSIVPKYGLINMILKAFFFAQVPDILFVPVSINYDRILEESLFAFELLGVPKPKESTSKFLKSLRIIREKFGNIYFHFDKPISAKEFFGGKYDRTVHSISPLHKQEITEQEKRLIPSLAYEIIRRQQLSSVISYFNLISLILNNNFTKGNQLRTSVEDLVEEVRILRNVLRSWGANIFERDIEQAIKDSLLVHQNLICRQVDGKIGLVTNKIVLDKLNPAKLKAHSLSEHTITYSVPFVMLQMYANPVLHYLVDSALIVVILRGRGKMSKDDLFRHFCILRSMFCFEFVLLENRYQMHFEEALDRLVKQNLIVFNNEVYDMFETNYLEQVLSGSIQPFILTYFIVIQVLQKLPEKIDEKRVLAGVQEHLEDVIAQHKFFIHPYCMTLDVLMNCLNSFSNMGFIKRNRQDDQNMYYVNREEVKKVEENLQMYIPAFQVVKSFEMFLHLKNKL